MLYIRADMNDTIATGHIMRCLSIADAAKELGENAVFLLADRQAVPLLKQRGYELIVLGSPWDNMEAELPALQNVIQERNIQTLLIDSYQVTPTYLEKVSQMASTIYMDDIDRFHYPVDALVYYAIDWESHCYRERYQNAGQNTKLLLGPGYAPLRKAFRHCCPKQIAPVARNLLLLSGGTDPYGILGKILEKAVEQQYGQIEVICGMYDPQYGHLCAQYHNFPNVHMYKAVNDIESYMKRADLAIAAGGTTLYELCSLGVPTVSYAMADNQLRNVQKFQENQVIDYAGDVRETDVAGNIRRFLALYHENAALRQERSQKMQALVDGEGAMRIAKEIIKLCSFEKESLEY